MRKFVYNLFSLAVGICRICNQQPSRSLIAIITPPLRLPLVSQPLQRSPVSYLSTDVLDILILLFFPGFILAHLNLATSQGLHPSSSNVGKP